MDPLSAAASIGSLIGVLTSTITYLKSCKDASKERKRFLLETCSLANLLRTLKDFLDLEEDDLWRKAVLDFAVQIQHMLTMTERLEKKLETSSRMACLRWSLVKDDAREVLTHVERMKTTVEIALQLDHLRLSCAIHGELKSLSGNALILRKRSDQHAFHSLLQWLNPSRHDTALNAALQIHHPGTNEWFLQSASFQSWLSGDIPTLFCPGRPGAGKTVTAAIAIDHLHQKFRGTNVAIAYHFCDYTQRSKLLTADILALIAKQILLTNGSAPSSLYSMRDRFEAKQYRPTVNDLQNILSEIVSEFDRVILIIDALDECPHRADVWSNIHAFTNRTKASLIVTSRFLPDVEKLLEQALRLDIQADPLDIHCFAHNQAIQICDRLHGTPELVQDIVRAVSNAADGIFLLAKLYLDSLQSKVTLRSLRAALSSTASGTGNQRYDQAYDAAMCRIESQDDDQAGLAKAALTWVAYAKRKLRVSELRHALAVESGDTELHADGMVDIGVLLSLCAGLLVVVAEEAFCCDRKHYMRVDLVAAEDTFVTLMHFTAQEYFDRQGRRWFDRPAFDLANTCITYLSFAAFSSGPCKDDETLRKLLHDNSLLYYAAKHWGGHVKDVENAGIHDQVQAIQRLVLPLLHATPMPNLIDQIRFCTAGAWPGLGKSPQGKTAYHLLARDDLVLTFTCLIQQSGFTDVVCDTGFTALHTSAGAGATSIIELLLDTGKVDVNARCFNGSTPLAAAVWNKRTACVDILLRSPCVDVNAADNFGQSPLCIASRLGLTGIAQKLLSNPDIDIARKSVLGMNCLDEVLRAGHTPVARLFMASGKLTTQQVATAAVEIQRLEEISLSATGVLDLLRKASGFEAQWRRNQSGCASLEHASRHGSFGTVQFILDQLQRCNRTEPGTLACHRECTCDLLGARCRDYISTASRDSLGSWRTAMRGQAKTWCFGLMDALEPWLLKDAKVMSAISLSQYLRIVSARLRRLTCDICQATSLDLFFHCEICHQSDWDVCAACVQQGHWCLDKTHDMWQWNVQNELVVVESWTKWKAGNTCVLPV